MHQVMLLMNLHIVCRMLLQLSHHRTQLDTTSIYRLKLNLLMFLKYLLDMVLAIENL